MIRVEIPEHHAEVLELEVVGLIAQQANAELIVVQGVQAPVATVRILGHHLAHPHTGAFRVSVAVRDLIEIGVDVRRQSRAGTGKQRQFAGVKSLLGDVRQAEQVHPVGARLDRAVQIAHRVLN